MMAMPLRIWMGWISIAALILLGLVLQLRIAPITDGFLPQTSVLGYTDADLQTFVAMLAAAGDLAAYRALLVWGDTATVLLFAWWIALSFAPCTGRALAGLYLLTEIAENAALLGATVPVSDPAADDMALAGSFTIAKFVVALPIVATILWQEIRGR